MQNTGSSLRKRGEKKLAKQKKFQDRFLNSLRKDDTKVRIETVNSKAYTGKIVSFDQYVVIINTDEGEVMLYKHALASVSKV
ncbi:MAG: RNA chaperone Hfq [bacterium]